MFAYVPNRVIASSFRLLWTLSSFLQLELVVAHLCSNWAWFTEGYLLHYERDPASKLEVTWQIRTEQRIDSRLMMTIIRNFRIGKTPRDFMEVARRLTSLARVTSSGREESWHVVSVARHHASPVLLSITNPLLVLEIQSTIKKKSYSCSLSVNGLLD